ncbi:hypothetical protein HHI36_018464 [Cryptolaemus montrouzieri]|uniref:Uncharacterized protein n=1 Tax=Cryptolaemus montrouzieri TaxID=559131 RepID=A0ABD2P0Z7_9CUCU
MRELRRLFRTYCSAQHSRGAYELPQIEEFLNEIVHESTAYSPKELQFGKERLKLLPPGINPKNVPGHYPKPSLEIKIRLSEACLANKSSFKEADLILLKANNTSAAIKSEIKKFISLNHLNKK